MRKVVTREQARQIELAKRAAQVPAPVRRNIQVEALGSQRVLLDKQYYSRIRFEAPPEEVEGVLSITFDAQKRYAFGYQLQREVDGHAGHNATYADTNLLEERSTNKGEQVYVYGISVRPTPFTDAYLMNMLDALISVVLRLDNENELFFGNPSDIPGGSQNGSGPTWVLEPDAEEYNNITEHHCTQKGHPSAPNVLWLDEPIVWMPAGADGKLDVMFELNQAIRYEYPASRAATDVTAVGAGDLAVVTDYTRPAEKGDPGTFVDYMVHLHCSTKGPRSVNG